jgi:hypothetical protein
MAVNRQPLKLMCLPFHHSREILGESVGVLPLDDTSIDRCAMAAA